MLRIPHWLDNLLTDGGKLVSLTHRLRSTPTKIFTNVLVLICRTLGKPQGLERAEGLGKLIKIIHLIGLEPANIWLVA
jgi:hypothetical protein